MSSLLFLEAAAGNDKGPNGRRIDSPALVQAARDAGHQVTQVAIDKATTEQLHEMIDTADVVLARINPGNLDDESQLFDLLTYAHQAGKVIHPDPDLMQRLGSKLLTYEIKDSPFGCEDTYVYRTPEEIEERLLRSIQSPHVRVYKRNRGSTGSGVRMVEGRKDIDREDNVVATEASDNSSYEMTVHEFSQRLTRYFEDEGELIIDMPYLPRIIEGELRIVFVGNQPVHIIHKKPEEGGFSATLFSGATYTDHSLEDYAELLQQRQGYLPTLSEKAGITRMPYLWTADFILDTDEKGHDRYVLGEINCTCVGISTITHIAPDIITEITS